MESQWSLVMFMKAVLHCGVWTLPDKKKLALDAESSFQWDTGFVNSPSHEPTARWLVGNGLRAATHHRKWDIEVRSQEGKPRSKSIPLLHSSTLIWKNRLNCLGSAAGNRKVKSASDFYFIHCEMTDFKYWTSFRGAINYFLKYRLCQ